jgi:hypothetical protein
VAIAIGQERTQVWVSRVETGKAVASSTEVVVLAAVVGADPVEALRVAGHLEEPPLLLIDRKLDTLIARRQVGQI